MYRTRIDVRTKSQKIRPKARLRHKRRIRHPLATGRQQRMNAKQNGCTLASSTYFEPWKLSWWNVARLDPGGSWSNLAKLSKLCSEARSYPRVTRTRDTMPLCHGTRRHHLRLYLNFPRRYGLMGQTPWQSTAIFVAVCDIIRQFLFFFPPQTT